MHPPLCKRFSLIAFSRAFLVPDRDRRFCLTLLRTRIVTFDVRKRFRFADKEAESKAVW